MRILVLGASGMLGHAIIRVFNEIDAFEVFGTVRSEKIKKYFPLNMSSRLIVNHDLTIDTNLVKIFKKVNPQVVINCVSLSKQLLRSADPLLIIPLYTLLPHRLSRFCKDIDARLINISSDGIFSGTKGSYTEQDPSDANDIYGKAKFLGETHEEHTLTIRTSIIGHELKSNNGLVEWFLLQKKQCECFSNAIFSGFPTVVLAQIIRDVIIPRSDLYGVYHIAAKPISKCDLLKLIAEVYGISINFSSNDKLHINRSLNANLFEKEAGYTAPNWEQLIKVMYAYNKLLKY